MWRQEGGVLGTNEEALLQGELVEVLRRLREGQLQDEAFEHLAEFCDRHPGIDPFTALASVRPLPPLSASCMFPDTESVS